MHFVFVPGPADPFDVSNLVLPRRPLPDSLVAGLKAKLPKVSFPSNPCRISYKSQEIVVFRDDLMSRMLRNTVRLKADLTGLVKEQLQEVVQNEMQREEEEAGRPAQEWSDERMGEARKKVLSQFVRPSLLWRSADDADYPETTACANGSGPVASRALPAASPTDTMGV